MGVVDREQERLSLGKRRRDPVEAVQHGEGISAVAPWPWSSPSALRAASAPSNIDSCSAPVSAARGDSNSCAHQGEGEVALEVGGACREDGESGLGCGGANLFQQPGLAPVRAPPPRLPLRSLCRRRPPQGQCRALQLSRSLSCSTVTSSLPTT